MWRFVWVVTGKEILRKFVFLQCHCFEFLCRKGIKFQKFFFSICYQWHYQTSDIDKIQDLSCHMVKTKHHEAIPIPTFSKTTMPTLKSKPSTFPDLSRQQTATTFATSNLLAAAAHSSTKPETPAQSFLSSTALPSSSLNVPGMLPSLSLPYPKTLGKFDFNNGTSIAWIIYYWRVTTYTDKSS